MIGNKTSKELRETVDGLRQATAQKHAMRMHKEEELILQQLKELERAHQERWNMESQQRQVTVNELRQAQLHRHEQQRTVSTSRFISRQIRNGIANVASRIGARKNGTTSAR
jgi:hypothetical protein